MHGGEVDKAAERYGVPRDQWLDLSTGINPNPYPIPDLAREYWYQLPDFALNAWLREVAARFYGIADPTMIVPAPGSQSVIQWLPRLIPPTRVSVVGPTYREHAACWSAAGHTVTDVGSPKDIEPNVGIVVIVNPNNPDGRVFEHDRLLALAGNRLLVVDEAFADLAPETSLVSKAGRPGLVILRSVGKFFGLAGMRLGFAITGEPLAGTLRGAMGPWAVSGPAAAVGAVALADDAWTRAARVRLTVAAGRLDGLLIRSGLAVVGGTTLFRLASHRRASDLFKRLAQNGILTRCFADQPEWVRFGIPGNDADFERLSQALSAWRTASGGAAGRGSGSSRR